MYYHELTVGGGYRRRGVCDVRDCDRDGELHEVRAWSMHNPDAIEWMDLYLCLEHVEALRRAGRGYVGGSGLELPD
jgi:hypothetical protein